MLVVYGVLGGSSLAQGAVFTGSLLEMAKAVGDEKGQARHHQTPTRNRLGHTEKSTKKKKDQGKKN